MQLVAYPCVPLSVPVFFGIFRRGYTFEQKLEVGELHSLTSYYTLTTEDIQHIDGRGKLSVYSAVIIG